MLLGMLTANAVRGYNQSYLNFLFEKPKLLPAPPISATAKNRRGCRIIWGSSHNVAGPTSIQDGAGYYGDGNGTGQHWSYHSCS